MDLGEAMGIGLYKTHDYYPGRYTHFEIHNNPFLKYIDPKRKSKEPVDYFISGAMAGGGCFVHKSICQNVETKCQAMGGDICDFLTGTEKELKNRGLWSIAVKRYDLKKILPIQMDIFKNYKDSREDELLRRIINEL